MASGGTWRGPFGECYAARTSGFPSEKLTLADAVVGPIPTFRFSREFCTKVLSKPACSGFSRAVRIAFTIDDWSARAPLKRRAASQASLDDTTKRIYNVDMEFAWPETKRAANLKVHGLDFVDASRVFEGATYTFEDD